MYFRRSLIILLFSAVLFSVALPVFAVDWWPIVPCGLNKPTQEEISAGKKLLDDSYYESCTKCDLFRLAKNILDFIAFGLVPAAAVLMFTFAGFLILLGGPRPDLQKKGMDLFKTTFWGLVILMMSWLITNTIIRSLAADNVFVDENNVATDWWKFECKEFVPAPDEEPPPATQKYDCNESNQCVAKADGQYTTADCGGKCVSVPPTQKYSCNESNQCVVDPDGTYTSGNCDDKCQAAPFSITTISLSDAIKDQSYSQILQATGGQTPYAWSISQGSLPVGLSLNSLNGVISGTPTTVGTSNFTVKIEDSSPSKQSAAKQLNIKVTNPVAGVTISEVASSNITSISATITWKTDKPSTSRVEYGTTDSYGSIKKDETPQTNHSIVLTGLSANTTYHYRAVSSVTGFTARTGDYTFKTLTGGQATECGDFDLVCSNTAQRCPDLVRDTGVPAGQSNWAYLIPGVAAEHSISGVDTAKFLEALMRIETNGRIDMQSGSTPPSCGIMQLQAGEANKYRVQCGVGHEVNCQWLRGRGLNRDETLEFVARASICMAAEYNIATRNGACYKGQPRDLAAGYNGGSDCKPEVKKDNALADSKSCSSAATADPKYEKDCSDRTTLRYECLWDDYAHTQCNTGFKETRDYVAKFNACYY